MPAFEPQAGAEAALEPCATPIPVEARCDPALYTEAELRAALECVDNLFGEYLRGKLRGGEMSWEDLDSTHDAAQVDLRRLAAASVRYWAKDYLPEEEWREAVSAGDTKLGYEEWLSHKIEANE